MDVQIPEKLYFKIGEVAELTGVKPHVLRYWESEFGSFRPVKSRSKQRLYRRKEIETALRIKDLLYNQGFTIAGAQKVLREKGPQQQVESKEQGQLFGEGQAPAERKLLIDIRNDLMALRSLLEPSGEQEPS